MTAVFGVGEKSAIQALDPPRPPLPVLAGSAERHCFEYLRDGGIPPANSSRSGTVDFVIYCRFRRDDLQPR